MSTIELYPPDDAVRRLMLARQERWAHLLLDTHALESVRSWLPSQAWCLALCRHAGHQAGTGRGKTLAMTAAWLGLDEQARTFAASRGRARGEVLYLRARDLRRVAERSRPELLARCSRAFGLVLDEVGTEPGGPDFSGFAREDLARDLADMLETRADRGRRTVFGGNATVEETFARYGQRLLSRAIEGGRGWLVQVKGDDLRVGDRVPPLPTEREVDGPWLEPVVLGARAAKAGRRYRGELVEAKRLLPPATVERRDGEALARSMAAARLLAYTEEAARRGEPWARTALCRAEPGPEGAA